MCLYVCVQIQLETNIVFNKIVNCTQHNDYL